MKGTETVPATPEHLIQMLEAQMLLQRARSRQASRNRLVFLVGGVLFIVLGAGVALVVLMHLLSDLRNGERPPVAQGSAGVARGNF